MTSAIQNHLPSLVLPSGLRGNSGNSGKAVTSSATVVAHFEHSIETQAGEH